MNTPLAAAALALFVVACDTLDTRAVEAAALVYAMTVGADYTRESVAPRTGDAELAAQTAMAERLWSAGRRSLTAYAPAVTHAAGVYALLIAKRAQRALWHAACIRNTA